MYYDCINQPRLIFWGWGGGAVSCSLTCFFQMSICIHKSGYRKTIEQYVISDQRGRMVKGAGSAIEECVLSVGSNPTGDTYFYFYFFVPLKNSRS